jgi:hypothetical protein
MLGLTLRSIQWTGGTFFRISLKKYTKQWTTNFYVRLKGELQEP